MSKISLFKFENGTYTLKDEKLNQCMHSSIGAELEAKLIYAEPGIQFLKKFLSLSEFLQPFEFTLWDVGMGTGSNVIQFLELLKSVDFPHLNSQNKLQLKVFSFESSIETLTAALKNIQYFPALKPFENNFNELLQTQSTSLNFKNVSCAWKLIYGDFSNVIQNQCFEKPHLIFYDMYAPNACPELWNYSLFSKITSHASEASNVNKLKSNLPRKSEQNIPQLLLTYTSATWVRASLVAGGFNLGEGTKTALKNQTTTACTQFTYLDHPIDLKKLFEKCERSNSPHLHTELRNILYKKIKEFN